MWPNRPDGQSGPFDRAMLKRPCATWKSHARLPTLRSGLQQQVPALANAEPASDKVN